jgi:lantibiotic modifying enzyme
MKPFTVQIAEYIEQNGLSCSNHGLMHGNMGMSIFFYHLARNTNNPEYDKIAGDLLDKAFDNMSVLASVDFENGLAGIGWGIEHLVQNNFIEADIDEILEEADNKVFKALNENPVSSFELDNGLTGYLFYLIYRLKNKTPSFSMAAQINKELIILTINKIDELVTSQFPNIVKEMQFDLFWRFPVMILGLEEAYKLTVYNDKIVCMFRQWLPYFEAYIPSLHINRLFLAVALKQINELMTDKRLEKQIQILLFATDFEILKTEVDHEALNLRNGWPGVALLLNIASKELPSDMPNYQLIEQTYKTIIERHNDTFENLSLNNQDATSQEFGLALGLSGIGLTELLRPGILSIKSP